MSLAWGYPSRGRGEVRSLPDTNPLILRILRPCKSRVIGLFFESIDLFYEQVQDWDRPEKLEAMREFYAACYRLDPEHDLTDELGRELARWG